MIGKFLSKLRNKKVIEKSSNNIIDKNDDNDCEEKNDTLLNLDLHSSLVGTKGWPCDALGFCYHQKQAIFICGTETGTIVCMGNDFQYTRTKFIDNDNKENDIAVRKIIPVCENKVLISNDDNSLAVLSIPTLEIIDIYKSDWLSKSYGNISCVYVDEPSDLNFVYIGTTKGYLIVLDISDDGSMRICDYLITLDEVGLHSQMSIRSIQICPQDDKYIAIAYRTKDDDDDNSEGAILIFDLVKKKAVKLFSTAAITTIVWNHTGTTLYAGTTVGDVLKIEFSSHHGCTLSDITVVWSYKNYYHEESNDFPVAIRTMQWLPSQESTSCLGCLFVSFIAAGNLINCMIGLAELNGKIEAIFELPKAYNEEILDFCLVPTIEKDEAVESAPVPALCIVFECDNDFDDSYIRVMKVVRCPKGDLSDWALEIGLLPEPRLPCEILGYPDWASVIFGMTSSSKNTLAKLFLNGAKIHYAEKHEEREFASDQFTENLEFSMDIENELLLSWNIVLSTCSVSFTNCEDVIILGHDNGLITVWAISNLLGKSGLGVFYWKKLQTINTGEDPVTHINIDNEDRLLIAGNSLGKINIFEMYDVTQNIGHIDMLKRRKSAALSSPLNIPRAFSEDVIVEQCIREFSTIYCDDMVTCSLIISEFTTMFFGTKTGSVLACNDMTEESLIEIEGIRNKIVPASEKNPVTGLVYGSFWKENTLCPACYVIYKSGHVCVIDVHNFEIIAYHYAALDDDADLFYKAYSKAFGYLLDKEYDIISNFDTLEIVKEMHSVGTRSRGSSIASRESSSFTETIDPDSMDAADQSTSPNTTKSSFFSSVMAATNLAQKTKQVSIPNGAPQYLLLIVGKYLVIHDLSRFAVFNPDTCKYGKVDITATSVSGISKQLIINCSAITINNNGENLEILSLQLLDGSCYLLNTRSRSTIGRCDLLENVEDKYIVDNAIFLKNGNSYLEKNGCFIVSSNVKVKGNELVHTPLSHNVILNIKEPEEKFKLNNGRKELLETKKVALQKRRQSIITITSGPTDLTKCFSKTKPSLSISTNEDYGEEEDVDVRGYSPRSVRKKSAFASSPKLNRNSNYLSKISMLLLKMNEEMKPETRHRQQTKLSSESSMKDIKICQKQEQRNQSIELMKGAQTHNNYEQPKNNNQKAVVVNESMLETKAMLEQRSLKLDRTNDKAEGNMNAAKQYRDALAEHNKKMKTRASRFW